MSPGLAVFDLDGTLSRHDTMFRFLFSEAGKWRVIFYLMLILPLIILMFIRLITVRYVKELLLKRFLGGKPLDVLQERGADFAEKQMPGFLYPAVYKALQTHRDQGDTVVLLTAACDLWAEPWCRKEGIIFIGTRLEVLNGFISGKISGPNCYGINKRIMLQAFLDEHQFSRITAYGNEKADLHYLRMADKAYLINNGRIKVI